MSDTGIYEQLSYDPDSECADVIGFHKNKVAYVAGPIRSKWRIKRWINILRARKVAIELWNAGFAVICPHLNSATLRHRVNEEQIVKADLLLVERSDFMVLVKGWRTSRGVEGEILHANYIEIPVYFDVEDAITNEQV